MPSYVTMPSTSISRAPSYVTGGGGIGTEEQSKKKKRRPYDYGGGPSLRRALPSLAAGAVAGLGVEIGKYPLPGGRHVIRPGQEIPQPARGPEPETYERTRRTVETLSLALAGAGLGRAAVSLLARRQAAQAAKVLQQAASRKTVRITLPQQPKAPIEEARVKAGLPASGLAPRKTIRIAAGAAGEAPMPIEAARVRAGLPASGLASEPRAMIELPAPAVRTAALGKTPTLVGSQPELAKGITKQLGVPADYARRIAAELPKDAKLGYRALRTNPRAIYDRYRQMVEADKQTGGLVRTVLGSERGAISKVPMPDSVPLPPSEAALARSIHEELRAAVGELGGVKPPKAPKEVPWTAGRVYNEVRTGLGSLKASLDLSAPRQGLLGLLLSPKTAPKVMGAMFKAAAHPAGMEAIADDIAGAKWYVRLKKGGMHFTIEHGGLLTGEEVYAPTLLGKLPGVGRLHKASNRGYAAMLSYQRSLIGNGLLDEAERLGLITDDYVKSTAEVVNTLTGWAPFRGSVGAILRRASPVLFAPHFIQARVNMLNPLWYAAQPAPLRMAAIKAMSRLALMGTAVMGLAATAGYKAGLNPFKSDFGQVDVGKGLHIGLFGGTNSYVRYTAQMGLAIYNQFNPPEWKSPDALPVQSIGRVAAKFGRGKLDPVASIILDWGMNEDWRGRKPTVARTVGSFVPFMLDDLRELWTRDASYQGIIIPMAISFFGGDIQVWETEDGWKK